MALGILEAAQEQEIIKPLLDMEHNSAEYLHALIEALRSEFISCILFAYNICRLAFADSLHWVTDPDCAPVSPSKLLSKVTLCYPQGRVIHYSAGVSSDESKAL